jgi:3-hydroxyacyl-[acyl-carrier-protein] dehydratase
LGLLPHGPEFRFIDRLIELDPGKSGVAVYTVRGTEAFLRGHFPDDPLFPGALLVESAVQLTGVVAQTDPQHAPLPDLKLTALRAVKILGSAGPGEVIRVEAHVTKRLGILVQARAEAYTGDRKLLEAEISLGSAPSKPPGKSLASPEESG